MENNTYSFLSHGGNYKNLVVFQKAERIYDITCYFVEHYLPQIGDRTVDQMKQAARSGKQNIAEGNESGVTSMKSKIHLINVAKASLSELLEDFIDYLRVKGVKPWDPDSDKCKNARGWCRTHLKQEDYDRVCTTRDDETVANIAIIMINQTIYLLKHLLSSLEKEFLQNGGISEQMTRARIEWRKSHGNGGNGGSSGNGGNGGSHGNGGNGGNGGSGGSHGNGGNGGNGGSHGSSGNGGSHGSSGNGGSGGSHGNGGNAMR